MNLTDYAAEKKVLIFDGAMGTELARKKLKGSGLVNLTGPEHILDIHRRYAATGVDILTTNSFTLNGIAVQAYGGKIDVEEINRIAVRLAGEAASGEMLVFGDIGPTGKLLKPYGDYSEDQFIHTFRKQARALVEEGVDGLIIETMTDLREALCALKGAREVTDKPIVVTMSYADTARGGRTVMGNAVAEVAAALQKHGANAVGANCGELSPLEMAQIAAFYREATSLPVLIQPNAGKPKLVGESTVYDMPPDDYAAGVKQCIDSGATLVGGCCGTTFEHMAAVVRLVKGGAH